MARTVVRLRGTRRRHQSRDAHTACVARAAAGRLARHEPAAAYAAADSGEKRHPALDRYNRGVADAEAAVAAFPGTGIVLRFGYFYGRDSDFTQQMIGAGRPGCRARRSPLRRRHRARPTSSSPPAGWGVVTITSA